MPCVWKLISFMSAFLQDNLLPSKPSILPPSIFNASFHFVRSICMSAEVSLAVMFRFLSPSNLALTLPESFKSNSVLRHVAYTFMSLSTFVKSSKSGIRASGAFAQPINSLFASTGSSAGNLPIPDPSDHPLNVIA